MRARLRGLGLLGGTWMGPTRRSERERAMQWPVAASTAPVSRGAWACDVGLAAPKEAWKSPARPMGAPRSSMANGRPAGEQDDMEASVAMADSLAEGVPDVCRSLADDERIRSRRPNGPACAMRAAKWAALIAKYCYTTATPTGNTYSHYYAIIRVGNCTAPHCTSTASDRLPWASSRVFGDGGCWPVRFPHAHARPCSGQLAAVAHVWYRVGWFPLETVSMVRIRLHATRYTHHAEPLRGHPLVSAARLTLAVDVHYYQAGGARKLIVSPPPPAALQGAPIRHGSEPRRASRLLLWQRAAHGDMDRPGAAI
ncbi:hypothetical protein COCSADRAFT_353804 [Bipolaris sorokiniana ND90Pr]|uniref:Uncharacterized protein n=1 Tax=Cochliobolus sativus (strain ND90Pr / ATCC 201652) TaxID=665912 RepID=M2RID7_COCSN|nr:uncharacterized protein COCSADRAFT_353804 [Bipolaris sorokiniana ND90Pr]EMD66499.1 hypothetical protein COCSADRAFT_353804 [Bipolaris sorokiniana ND90Pr]